MYITLSIGLISVLLHLITMPAGWSLTALMSLIYLVEMSIRTLLSHWVCWQHHQTTLLHLAVPTPEHSSLHCGSGAGGCAGPHDGSLPVSPCRLCHCSPLDTAAKPNLSMRLISYGSQSPRCCDRSSAFMPKVDMPDVFQLCSVCPTAWALMYLGQRAQWAECWTFVKKNPQNRQFSTKISKKFNFFLVRQSKYLFSSEMKFLEVNIF